MTGTTLCTCIAIMSIVQFSNNGDDAEHKNKYMNTIVSNSYLQVLIWRNRISGTDRFIILQVLIWGNRISGTVCCQTVSSY